MSCTVGLLIMPLSNGAMSGAEPNFGVLLRNGVPPSEAWYMPIPHGAGSLQDRMEAFFATLGLHGVFVVPDQRHMLQDFMPARFGLDVEGRIDGDVSVSVSSIDLGRDEPTILFLAVMSKEPDLTKSGLRWGTLAEVVADLTSAGGTPSFTLQIEAQGERMIVDAKERLRSELSGKLSEPIAQGNLFLVPPPDSDLPN